MPQWTTSRILEASPISFGKFSGKLFVYSFFSYCAAALAWWVWSSFLESPLKDPLRQTAVALLWLPFLVLYYPFSFAAAYFTIFGERIVSHDVVNRYPISKEVLIAVFIFLALSLAARKLVLGRVFAYIFVAAFTVGAAINWFAMIQQG